MRLAILFRTHLLNGPVLNEFRRLKDSCSSFADVWLLYHCEKPVELQPDGPKTFVYTTAQIKELGWPFRDFWYNGDYPLLLFWRQYSNYHYYWMIEYDVRYTGCWSDFFQRFDQDDADFLASYLLTYEEDPGWPWWYESSIECSMNYRRRAFFPVIRMSQRAVGLLHDARASGVTGLCEPVTTSTLLLHEMRLADLNSAPTDTRTVYENDTLSWHYTHVCSWMPKKNRLYHPIYALHTRKGLSHFLHSLSRFGYHLVHSVAYPLGLRRSNLRKIQDKLVTTFKRNS